ncbi:hypothetical protein MTO98_09575 [Mucilaginibacter sp. SMC90]|uniref:hypothetical protein n=1 Tax=Mucilaginibacter sp. SMC90 TaxID=2929803 RepID=UPI001FB345E9|nr:hypothetical protein [Mucilaginibacter sp. SMC90]UOE51327.1 hypothetical protein MTO98_09575 [Mucilaginibacter sp. SMC90]
MPSSDPAISTEDLKGRFYKLSQSLKAAASKEAAASGNLRGSYKPEIADLKVLASVKLPEAFGKLIVALDLQNAFLSLGHYVRSFTDAVYVLEKLNGLIIERLAGGGQQNAIVAALDALSECAELYLTITAA